MRAPRGLLPTCSLWLCPLHLLPWPHAHCYGNSHTSERTHFSTATTVILRKQQIPNLSAFNALPQPEEHALWLGRRPFLTIRDYFPQVPSDLISSKNEGEHRVRHIPTVRGQQTRQVTTSYTWNDSDVTLLPVFFSAVSWTASQFSFWAPWKVVPVTGSPVSLTLTHIHSGLYH